MSGRPGRCQGSACEASGLAEAAQARLWASSPERTMVTARGCPVCGRMSGLMVCFSRCAGMLPCPRILTQMTVKSQRKERKAERFPDRAGPALRPKPRPMPDPMSRLHISPLSGSFCRPAAGASESARMPSESLPKAFPCPTSSAKELPPANPLRAVCGILAEVHGPQACGSPLKAPELSAGDLAARLSFPLPPGPSASPRVPSAVPFLHPPQAFRPPRCLRCSLRLSPVVWASSRALPPAGSATAVRATTRRRRSWSMLFVGLTWDLPRRVYCPTIGPAHRKRGAPKPAAPAPMDRARLAKPADRPLRLRPARSSAPHPSRHARRPVSPAAAQGVLP